jgi:hypothetical protein
MGRRLTRIGALVTVFLFVGALLAPAAIAGNWLTELHEPHQGTVGHGHCEWHFVHTKAPNGSDPIKLKIKTNRGYQVIGESVKIQANGKNQHWTVTTNGWTKLKNAWTNQTGKLVLSDLTCKKPPSGGGYS